MAKNWYAEIMGQLIGPMSGQELAEKVRVGQIQLDTPIRRGDDGAWAPAEQWKGLFEAAFSPPVMAANKSSSKKSKQLLTDNDTIPIMDAASSPIPLAGGSPETTLSLPVVPSAPVDPALLGQKAAPTKSGFEFFEFVGYRSAIGNELHDVLTAFSRESGMGITDITKTALAQFLGRPDLIDSDKPSS